MKDSPLFKKDGFAKSNFQTQYNYKLKLPGLLRMALCFLLFVLQVILVAFLARFLEDLGLAIYIAMQVFGFFLVFFVIRTGRNASYTLAWTIAIMGMPAMGPLLYLLWGRRSRFNRLDRSLVETRLRLSSFKANAKERLAQIDSDKLPLGAKLQLGYLAHNDFPLYQNTSADYYSSGEEQFEHMFEDLEQAKSFIFMEYFIVAEGYIWDRLQEILIRKAKEGVEVRFMMDDFGRLAKVPEDLVQHLRRNGIKAQTFNPVLRYISRLFVNYRNHQKICIIDGQLAYIGGTNLADEYANIYERFGYWKDSAVRLKGEAVRGATLCFLLLWEAESRKHELSYERYLPTCDLAQGQKSIFVPYWDGPVENPFNPAEDMFLSLISSATERLYISTPYFIVDDPMINAICRAAESGVDVRLITPAIPDKRYVFKVTRSNYGRLLASGVQVYEFTPGFIHAKNMIADGNRLITGSINLDYRSLYLHFENAVYICDDPVIAKVEKDYLATVEESHKITLAEWKARPLIDKIFETLLRIFSPLL